MCESPNSSLVRHTIELKYANRQRTAALQWLLLNGALLAVLAYDLLSWCGGCGGGALAWAEALGALVLAANCAQHAARLLRPACAPRPAPQALSPAQRRLLGLTDADLDSSFVVTSACSTPERSPAPSEEPGSLSPRRSWRARSSPPSAPGSSPPTPPAPASPPSPHATRAGPDEFISDGRALAAYIRQAEARAAGAGAGADRACVLPAPPRAHQLAVLPDRSKDQSEEEGAVKGGAPLWRRLHVDPQRLTEYNLNLRLWLHVTVVGRVARELAAAEAAGAAGVQHEALLPFLAPFADKQYVANRIKELSCGGCLSGYRWDGGGRGWHAASGQPTDAELLLHLFAAYLDLVAPGGGFSARHVSLAPAPAPAPHPARLVLRRVARLSPHLVLLLGEDTLEVGAGRNNLLHALLLFLAAAARARPPALCRLHLGPAGLNMLWILGR